MSLSVHVSSDDGVVVVALAGTADAAMVAPLQAPLSEALADTRLLVLDLDGLTGVDADSLRAVIVALLEEARGGQLRIVAPDPDLRGRLAAARIHHLVAVHPSVGDAIYADDPAGR